MLVIVIYHALNSCHGLESCILNYLLGISYISVVYEALLGVLGIRDNWANYLRDKGELAKYFWG